MKYIIDSEKHKQLSRHDKMYGTTTVGAKGQIVIPADARKDLGLVPGDKLIVMGQMGTMIGLIRADQLGSLVDMMMNHIAGTGMEKDFKDHVKKMFGNVGSSQG